MQISQESKQFFLTVLVQTVENDRNAKSHLWLSNSKPAVGSSGTRKATRYQICETEEISYWEPLDSTIYTIF